MPKCLPYGSANQNHNKITLHINQSGYDNFLRKEISIFKDVSNQKPSLVWTGGFCYCEKQLNIN